MIAHEYFHNWTGDRITCRDWFQLCLKEGLTVFRDQEFTADQRSRAVERISDVRAPALASVRRGRRPARPSGAARGLSRDQQLLHLDRLRQGRRSRAHDPRAARPETFRKGMDLYFDRHDGEAATVEQFVQCFADVSRRDMTQFMRWYSQAGTPDVGSRRITIRARRTYRLDITQTVPPTPGQPTKEPMLIPLALGLVGKDGADLPLVLDGKPLVRGVIELTRPNQSFLFTDIAERPVPSLNRDFSAPIKLSLPIDADDLRFLAAHDSDPFNRWQAVQSLAMTLLKSQCRGAARRRSAREDDGLMAALGAILADAKLEPAFIALTLSPPSEADIAREIGSDVDPDAIFAARRKLRAAIGAASRRGTGRRLIERMIASGPYRPDAESVGRRALKNVCLDLLAVTESGRRDRARVLAVSRCRQHDRPHGRAGNAGAARRPERTAALEDFYQRYADDPLIIDKWLALQAAIPEAATLDRVRTLTRHPAFSVSNPNRVRALIGSFAQANQTQFNRVDGAGYDFVADFIIALDPKNPQVAARLMGAFRSWRALEATRRKPRRGRLAPRRRDAGAVTRRHTTSSRARWPIVKRADIHDRHRFDRAPP